MYSCGISSKTFCSMALALARPLFSGERQLAQSCSRFSLCDPGPVGRATARFVGNAATCQTHCGVAVKELKLSYYIGETLLFYYIYPL